MNEAVLYTLAEVAIALAGFSGIVAAFRVRESYVWSATERPTFGFWLVTAFSCYFSPSYRFHLVLQTGPTRLFGAFAMRFLALISSLQTS